MNNTSDSTNQRSQPLSTQLDERREEREKLNKAREDCQARKTSTYITLNGQTYLVTPQGVMSYEGTTTVAYSQSPQAREMSAKKEGD